MYALGPILTNVNILVRISVLSFHCHKTEYFMYTEKLDFKPNAVWLLRWTVLLYNMRRPFMKYKQSLGKKIDLFQGYGVGNGHLSITCSSVYTLHVIAQCVDFEWVEITTILTVDDCCVGLLFPKEVEHSYGCMSYTVSQ